LYKTGKYEANETNTNVNTKQKQFKHKCKYKLKRYTTKIKTNQNSANTKTDTKQSGTNIKVNITICFGLHTSYSFYTGYGRYYINNQVSISFPIYKFKIQRKIFYRA
jgi:hypothetical protein